MTTSAGPQVKARANSQKSTGATTRLSQQPHHPNRMIRGSIMKTARKAAAAAAALALLLTLNACGTAASGDSGNPSPTEIGLRDISEGVQPAPKAVSLLPQSYKDKGELTVAADPNSPPTIFLAQDNH